MSPSSDRMAGLGQEVKLLAELVLDNSAPWLESLEAAGHGSDTGEHAPSAHEPAEEGAGDEASDDKHPGWCPWCMLVDLARRDRPDISGRAMGQATQLVSVLRAVLADRFHPAEGVHLPSFGRGSEDEDADAESDVDDEPAAGDAEASEPAPQPRRNGSRVQRIPVRKAPRS